MFFTGFRTRVGVLCLLVSGIAAGQSFESDTLVSSGEILWHGQMVTYRIRYLPVASFPELPLAIAGALSDLGCLIPQTYEAHRPENVVRGNFEAAGSADWALLCSRNRRVTLLVFFGSRPGHYTQLAEFAETGRLQAYPGSQVLGFNWGVDRATPGAVRDAQSGMTPRPGLLDHDAVEDSEVDQRSIYHYFANGSWTVAAMPH
jgi:hypothetical protein